MCSNPLMIVLNPVSEAAYKRMSVPLFFYEIKENKFQPVDYQLASSEIEQIAVTHVAQAVDRNQKLSGISQNMKNILNAISILRQKLGYLIKVTEASPEVRAN